MKVSIVYLAWIFFSCLVAGGGDAAAQPRPGEDSAQSERGRPPREGERRGRSLPEELRQRFDKDGDGDLNEAERDALREFMRSRGGGPGGRGPDGRGPGGRGPGGRGPGGSQKMRLVEKFDDDGNGRLDVAERVKAREYRKSQGQGRGSRRGGGRGFSGRVGSREDADPPRDPERVAVGDVETYPDRPLYAPGILRTLFLEFAPEDWEQEMADFYRTDVAVPADLTVDGKKYPAVGVGFRGNSSFFSVSAGKKRSLNIAIDHSENGRKLYGYKTLNLLNSNSDPSFLRHVLHDHIAASYLPTTKANLVKLVINGESWGIYVNVQQYNSDFLDDWFGTRKGARWKVPQGRSGKGLSYNGDEIESYRAGYQMKTRENPAAWRDLVEVTRVLDATPAGELVAKLDPLLNIDRALWFLAIDSVLMDGDGYFSRGSDFFLYQDPSGRFHVLPHDSNETFNTGGGRGGRGGRGGFRRGGGRPPGGFGERGRRPEGERADRPRGEGRTEDRPRGERGAADGRGEDRPRGERRPGEDGGRRGDRGRGGPDGGGGGITRAPIVSEDDPGRPLISRLFKVPELRARYLAHVRTIAAKSLDWEEIGPVARGHHTLIADEIAKDTRKLTTTASFRASLDAVDSGDRRPSIKGFVDERRKFLLGHSDIKKPHPVIESVVTSADAPSPENAVTVTAKITGDVSPEKVILYHASGKWSRFVPVEMQATGGGKYAAELPAMPAGTDVRYYVEARAPADVGSTVFHPAATEMAALSYTVRARVKEGFDVRFHSWLASNVAGATDPQGDHDDWIKLHNGSEKDIDLSGMYLSDAPDAPRKWRFPRGTTIVAGGYLVVWADEDARDRPGFHASFKLSETGETLLLVDRDDRHNAILDRVEFGAQEVDLPFRRHESSSE